MKIGISEAARRAGVDRKVIYRMMEKGRITKELNEDGQPRIDLSELARLYPDALTTPGQDERRRKKTPDVAQQAIEALRERLNAAEEDKAQLRHELERARNEHDRRIEREQAERDRLMALLEGAQRQLSAFRPAEAMPTPPQHRGFWAWLTARPA